MPRWPQKIAELTTEQLADTAILTDTELLQVLSHRARAGSTADAKLFNEITRAKGTSLGPPPPTTREEQIERMGALMRAIGKNASEEALGRAFAKPKSAGGPAATVPDVIPS